MLNQGLCEIAETAICDKKLHKMHIGVYRSVFDYVDGVFKAYSKATQLSSFEFHTNLYIMNNVTRFSVNNMKQNDIYSIMLPFVAKKPRKHICF